MRLLCCEWGTVLSVCLIFHSSVFPHGKVQSLETEPGMLWEQLAARRLPQELQANHHDCLPSTCNNCRMRMAVLETMKLRGGRIVCERERLISTFGQLKRVPKLMNAVRTREIDERSEEIKKRAAWRRSRTKIITMRLRDLQPNTTAAEVHACLEGGQPAEAYTPLIKNLASAGRLDIAKIILQSLCHYTTEEDDDATRPSISLITQRPMFPVANSYHYAALSSGCEARGDVEGAMWAVAEMQRRGIPVCRSQPPIGRRVCCAMSGAERGAAACREVLSAAIAACAKGGEWERGLRLFRACAVSISPQLTSGALRCPRLTASPPEEGRGWGSAAGCAAVLRARRALGGGS